MKTKYNISAESSQFQGKSRIFDSIRGVYFNKILRTAINLELFTALKDKPLTGEEIKTRLKLNGRGLYDFLDALVSLDLLDRDLDIVDGERNGSAARYSNTKETSLFLVKDSPYYIGGWFEHKMKEFKQVWGNLEEALKTGKPVRQDMKETGKDLFELNYDTDKESSAFVDAQNFGQLGSFNDFSRKFDFSGYHTLCDIGGGNGLFSILIAEQNKHMKCLTLDLPVVEPYALKKVKESGLSDRITVMNGNFFEDDFPKADVITMGNILHDWNLEQKKLLIAKAYKALTSGGALVAIENVIDNERRRNTGGFFMSLHMLLVTEGGFDFTAANFNSWVREAGFKKTAALPLEGNSSAVIAYK